jgi:hypothetical protein
LGEQSKGLQNVAVNAPEYSQMPRFVAVWMQSAAFEPLEQAQGAPTVPIRAETNNVTPNVAVGSWLCSMARFARQAQKAKEK